MDQQDFWDDYQHVKKEITRLRGSEERLKGVRARYAALGTVLDGLLMVLDKSGLLLELNEAGISLLGLSGKVVGKRIAEVLPGSAATAIEQAAHTSLERKEVRRAEFSIPGTTGPAKTFTARLAPVFDDTNRAVAVVLVARDTTALIQLAEQLDTLAGEVAQLRERLQAELQIARGDSGSSPTSPA